MSYYNTGTNRQISTGMLSVGIEPVGMILINNNFTYIQIFGNLMGIKSVKISNLTVL